MEQDTNSSRDQYDDILDRPSQETMVCVLKFYLFLVYKGSHIYPRTYTLLKVKH